MFEDQENIQNKTGIAQGQPGQRVEDIFENTDSAPVASSQPPTQQINNGANISAKANFNNPNGHSALSSGKIKPVDNPAYQIVPKDQMSGSGNSSFPIKKILFIFFIIIFVLAFAGMSYAFWSGFDKNDFLELLGKKESQQPQNQVQDESQDLIEDQSQDEPEGQSDEDQEEVNSTSTSSWFDDFQQEQVENALDPFGDSDIKDTDQDGLTDLREAEIGTNPRLVDSDSDGLSDWEEANIFGTDPLKTDSDGDSYLDGEEVQNGYNPLGDGKLLDIEE